jgi:hypothetical protein
VVVTKLYMCQEQRICFYTMVKRDSVFEAGKLIFDFKSDSLHFLKKQSVMFIMKRLECIVVILSE